MIIGTIAVSGIVAWLAIILFPKFVNWAWGWRVAVIAGWTELLVLTAAWLWFTIELNAEFSQNCSNGAVTTSSYSEAACRGGWAAQTIVPIIFWLVLVPVFVAVVSVSRKTRARIVATNANS